MWTGIVLKKQRKYSLSRKPLAQKCTGQLQVIRPTPIQLLFVAVLQSPGSLWEEYLRRPLIFDSIWADQDDDKTPGMLPI